MSLQVYHGISLLNAFFLEKERELLRQLAFHSAAAQHEKVEPVHEQLVQPDEAAGDAFFAEAASLNAYVVLNYLALIKILKKHDKHSAPITRLVLEHVFQQAFYLSLEHSYLFSTTKRLMHYRCATRPLPQQELPPNLQQKVGVRPSLGDSSLGQRGAIRDSNGACEQHHEDEMVSPKRGAQRGAGGPFELCLLINFEIGEVDFSALR